MAEVALQDVDKVYSNGFHAVKDLTLEIEDGEFLVLVGPSGCGKTTALRMVAGLETITDGEISIDGRVVNDMTPKERDIAMVFQSYALYPHLSVADNIAFGLRLRRMPQRVVQERTAWAAQMLDLTPYLDRKPKQLSGGQRQRVAMGRAIVREPKVFLMDEPLSNLDAKLRVQMRGEIAKLQHDLATTTIYVTHDQVEAMTMGDRVAVMNLGVLQQIETPQRLYDEPANLFVAGFIGTPPMNLLASDVGVAEGKVTVSLAGQPLEVPDTALDRYRGLVSYNGRTVAMGIRSEDLHPARAPARAPQADRPPRAARGARVGDGRVLPHRRAHDPQRRREHRRRRRGGCQRGGHHRGAAEPRGDLPAAAQGPRRGGRRGRGGPRPRALLRRGHGCCAAVSRDGLRRGGARSRGLASSRPCGAIAAGAAVASGQRRLRLRPRVLRSPLSRRRRPGVHSRRSGSTSSSPTATRTARRRTTAAGAPGRGRRRGSTPRTSAGSTAATSPASARAVPAKATGSSASTGLGSRRSGSRRRSARGRPGRQRRLPRLLDHRPHGTRPAPRYRGRVRCDGRVRAPARPEGDPRRRRQPHGRRHLVDRWQRWVHRARAGPLPRLPWQGLRAGGVRQTRVPVHERQEHAARADPHRSRPVGEEARVAQRPDSLPRPRRHRLQLVQHGVPRAGRLLRSRRPLHRASGRHDRPRRRLRRVDRALQDRRDPDRHRPPRQRRVLPAVAAQGPRRRARAPG